MSLAEKQMELKAKGIEAFGGPNEVENFVGQARWRRPCAASGSRTTQRTEATRQGPSDWSCDGRGDNQTQRARALAAAL